MQAETLRYAHERLDTGMGEGKPKILLVDGCAPLIYENLDFVGPYDSDMEPLHVWLYLNRLAVACVDLRSVIGVTSTLDVLCK